MALEYNICGFESAGYGETSFGGTVFAAGMSIQGSTPRSGTYRFQLITTNAVSNLVFFPAGDVTGTSGTVSSGNHKRVRLRLYIRIDSQYVPFGNSQIRLFGLGGEFDTNGINVWMDGNRKFKLKIGPGLPTIGGAGYDIGVATIVTPLQCIGTTNVVSAGTVASHGFQTGASVTIAGAANAVYNGTYTITVTGTNTFTYVIASNQPSTLGAITATYVSGPTESFIGPVPTAQWYRFILDVDYNVSSNTAVTVGLQVTEDSAIPGFDQSLALIGTIGNTDDMRKVSFCSERIRNGFDYGGTFSYDDVVYYGSSSADAVNPLALPSENKIKAVPITGVGDGILVNAGPDQIIYSLFSILAGSISTYPLNTYGLSGPYTNASEIPVDLSGGGLGAYLQSSLDTGTYIMFSHATAAVLGIASVGAMKIYCNGAISGAGTGLIRALLGGTETTTITKDNTWLTQYSDQTGALSPSVLISVLGWTAAQFNELKFGIMKLNGTQITRIGNILAEALYS